jgi:hypothetical protein
MDELTEEFIESMWKHFDKKENTINLDIAHKMYRFIKFSLPSESNKAIIVNIKYGFAKNDLYNPFPPNLSSLINFLESLEYVDWNSFLKQLSTLENTL